MLNILALGLSILFVIIISSCSNQKNTALTRFYHSTNTRYNIYFNAEQAYKETLENVNKSREDNLSQRLYIFPDNSDSAAMQLPGGSYTTTIDKTTKAIKLHSIKTKPKRDPGRRNDSKYQAWLQQKEYTPFMDKVWLLLGKSEFNEANYLRSITTFMYISKIYNSNPDIVAECQLWISRAYSEMGWMYEAGNILYKMELAGDIPESQKSLYSAVKANYLIRSNDIAGAIPHLEYAIKKEKDKHQKLRLKYLLGQLYVETGDKANADKAFASVQGMNTPYNYTFNAKLQQLQLNTREKGNVIASLTKMAKSPKNKEYQDQLYFSIGNIYMQIQDTTKAIDNYKRAIKESTRNGYDKAAVQIVLGDIYFDRREFILAQPCYSEALGQLLKSHADYNKVSHRSAVLDELVVHVKTVYEQDSLQHLAQLPENERLEIINKKIEDLKKEEKNKQKEEERLKQEEERGNRISSWDEMESALFEPQKTPNIPPPSGSFMQQSGGGSMFYFYNEQSVAQGKTAFQKQWGNRKLEDDWRRRNKENSLLSALDTPDTSDNPDDLEAVEKGEAEQGAELTDANKGEGDATTNDIYSVEYYLQQLPFTPEAIQQSDELIEHALFNMGKIYKDKLENVSLAIEAFNTDINRFPQTPNLEEIYYQLFLIYMQTGDQNMMSIYRSKILGEFPQGQYATPLGEPDYEWNFRHMPILQDSLYSAAYNAYKKADVHVVRDNYQAMKKKYPLTDLMPKFALLNALSYAQTRDAKNLTDGLTEITEKYPKADITPLATDILNRIKEGKMLLSDGSPITDFDWSKAYVGDSTMVGEGGKALAYTDSANLEYLLLLMYKSNTIDRNELLYQVADYNFSNYVIQTFDLNFETDPPYDVLQIRGFASLTNIKSYLNKALTDDGLVHKIDSSILVLPISVENYTKNLPRLGLEEYISFFAEHYKDQLPRFVAYWNGNKDIIESESDLVVIDNDEVEISENTENISEEIKQKEDLELPDEDIVLVLTEKKKEPEHKSQDKLVDKEINADDLLTKEQLEGAGKINDAVEKIEDVISNPVDGIKNLFSKYQNREKLTKEEKAVLKEQKKLEKEDQKQLKAIDKLKQDSINKIEKEREDSIFRTKKAVQDSINTVEKHEQQQKQLEKEQKNNAVKASIKAKEDARKQKEEERKEKEHLQKERLKQREKERKEKEKNREKERREKEQQAAEKRKQRDKDRR